MSGFLTIRDSIRDFLRKYDEIAIPVLKFIASLIMFTSINNLFGYSSLFDKGVVIFLMSVICALVSASSTIILASAVILVNCLSVSVEIGLVFMVLFILMFCSYMRMFPKSSYILALVPILCMWNLYYAIPLVVAIVAGAAGMVPTAFGLVVYEFADCITKAIEMKETATEEENFQYYSYIVEELTKNKSMLLGMIVFAVVILISYVVYKLSIDYAWYISIAVGALCNIIFFLVGGSAVDVSVSAAGVFGGTILGVVIAVLLQICKSILNYARKEVVQFEDDDYYYYVKAIPKFKMSTKKKSVKKMTNVVAADSADNTAKNIPVEKRVQTEVRNRTEITRK